MLTRQMVIPMNAVPFRGSHDTLTGGNDLPTPDVNISHHIIQQALEHEAACVRQEAGESRKKRKGQNDWQDYSYYHLPSC